MLEYQKQSDKEKEVAKGKYNDMEGKYKEADRVKNQLKFDIEKEKARWEMEKGHILSLNNDLKDKIEKLEKKKDTLVKEIEKLKYDKQNRKPMYNMVNGSFAGRYV